jgi:hypothetical protein
VNSVYPVAPEDGTGAREKKQCTLKVRTSLEFWGSIPWPGLDITAFLIQLMNNSGNHLIRYPIEIEFVQLFDLFDLSLV